MTGNGNAELIEPFAAPEFFVEGSAQCEVRNGNLFWTGYRLIDGMKVATVRLVIPLTVVPAVRAAISQALNGPEIPVSNVVSLVEKLVN